MRLVGVRRGGMGRVRGVCGGAFREAVAGAVGVHRGCEAWHGGQACAGASHLGRLDESAEQRQVHLDQGLGLGLGLGLGFGFGLG